MILTDRIKVLAHRGKPPQGALEEVHAFYRADEGEPESFGTVVQYWAERDTHFFVVMIDGRCDCLRVWKGMSHGLDDGKWLLSVDSQTKFTDDPVGDPSGEDCRNRLERGS